MTTQLLIENAPFTLQLEEAKDPSGASRYIVRGQFARSDRATENKRLYKESLWKREIGRLAEQMKGRRAYGELDHPADGRTKLTRVSHLMTGLHVEGNEVVGEAEILDTPNGRILKTLFQAKAQVGVSSRGYGSTKSLSDGTEEVQEDFRLDTFDFVADPATKTAYPKVFQEEREHITQAETVLTVESLKRDYSGLLSVIAEESVAGFNKQIVEAEDRAAKRLRGTFATELRKVTENLSEEAHRMARSELLSDPTVAAAKTVIENIISLVTPFGMGEKIQAEVASRDQEIVTLRAKLADRELEVQKESAEKVEMEKLARKAGYQLHLERKVNGHSSKETITRLIGPVEEYRSIKDMDDKIDALLKEFKDTGRPGGGSERHDELIKQIEMLRTEAVESKDVVRRAHADRDEALAKARQAVELSETYQVRLHVERVAGARPDIDRIRNLTEDVRSIEDANRIIDNAGPAFRGSAPLGSDEAERIRARVGRAKVSPLPGDQNPLTEEKSGTQDTGILGQVGLSSAEFDRLSGTQPQSRGR